MLWYTVEEMKSEWRQSDALGGPCAQEAHGGVAEGPGQGPLTANQVQTVPLRVRASCVCLSCNRCSINNEGENETPLCPPSGLPGSRGDAPRAPAAAPAFPEQLCSADYRRGVPFPWRRVPFPASLVRCDASGSPEPRGA